MHHILLMLVFQFKNDLRNESSTKSLVVCRFDVLPMSLNMSFHVCCMFHDCANVPFLNRKSSVRSVPTASPPLLEPWMVLNCIKCSFVVAHSEYVSHDVSSFSYALLKYCFP